MQDQHQIFENTLQTQFQKKIEQIKDLKERYENPKEEQMKMDRCYNK